MTLIDLPLLMKDAVRGKRSAVTCALKCASQCAFGPCNHGDNPTCRDIASSPLTRRAAIGGGTGALAIALAGTLGACSGGPSGSGTAATDEGSSTGDEDPAPNGTALAFAAIAPVDEIGRATSELQSRFDLV